MSDGYVIETSDGRRMVQHIDGIIAVFDARNVEGMMDRP